MLVSPNYGIIASSNSGSVPTPLLDLDAYKVSSYPGSGTTWYNIGSLGSAVNVTVSDGSPTWNAAGYFVFDGNDAFAKASPTGLPIGTSAVTWSALIYLSASNGNYQHPLGLGENGSTARLDYVTFDPTGKIGISGYGCGLWSSDTKVAQWICLQGTSTAMGDLSTYSIRINGSSVILTGTDGAARPTSTELALGRMANNAGTTFFNGRIMRLAIWNTVLTAAQLNSDFASVRGRVGI